MTAATTGVIRGNSALIANVGDSRAVGSISGRAVALSVDHKPNLPAERARIQNAGGTVCMRVTAAMYDCCCVWLLLYVAAAVYDWVTHGLHACVRGESVRVGTRVYQGGRQCVLLTCACICR